MRQSKISKSVRLLPHHVAYIERFPGDGFTEKLSACLEESLNGEATRKEQLKYYDNLIEQRRKEISAMNDLALSLGSFSRSVQYCETVFARLQAALQKVEKNQSIFKEK